MMEHTDRKDFGLPQSVIDFLKSGKQLEYYYEQCFSGQVELMALEDLCLIELVIERKDQPHIDCDPHKDEDGYYVIEAVSLISSYETPDDYPGEILLWYPEYEEFGQWDQEHQVAYRFPDRTWTHITMDPETYLDPQWCLGGMVIARILPWLDNTGSFRKVE